MKLSYPFWFLVILILTSPLPQNAQGNNKNFQDLLLQKVIYKKNGTHVKDNLELNFLWGTPIWATLSNEILLKTPLHIFTPMAAIYTSYVYQEATTNFFEIRPWIGGKFLVPLTDKIHLYNRNKVELRNFLYVREIPRNKYARLRTMVGFEYFLKKNPVKNTAWSIDANYEWFFFQAPAQDEQYANFRKFTLKLKRYFANNHTLLFKLESNQFLSDATKNKDQGLSLTLEYDFW